MREGGRTRRERKRAVRNKDAWTYEVCLGGKKMQLMLSTYLLDSHQLNL